MALAAVISRKRRTESPAHPQSQSITSRLARNRTSYVGSEYHKVNVGDSDGNVTVAVGRRRLTLAVEPRNDATFHLEDDEPTALEYRDLVYYLFEGFPAPKFSSLYPRWWVASDIIGKLNFFFVVLSSLSFATETLPEFYRRDYLAFSVIEWVCVMFFTVDILIRLGLTRQKLKWLRSVLNWIDIASIVPFYVNLGTKEESSATGGFIMFRTLRLMRILRVLKLSKHNVGLEAVVEALTESSEAISLLAFLLIIALVLFSSAVFFAEQTESFFDSGRQLWIQENGRVSPFQSIFHSMWWCIVTITTVGYGDAVPVSVLGKIVGSVTMICGVFVIAFPTVILSTNFQEIHQAKVEAQKQLEAELLHHQQQMEHEKELSSQGQPDTQQETPEAKGENEGTSPAVPVVGAPVFLDEGGPIYLTYSFKPSQGFAGVFMDEHEEDPGAKHDILVVDNHLAIYEPTLYFQCTADRNLHVRIERFGLKTVATFQLLLESPECLSAVEAALEEYNPNHEFQVVARPISKIRVEMITSLPALSEARLMTNTFVEPAGALPISMLIPTPDLVNVLLTNVASISFKLTVSFDNPSALDEPLIHYGGMVLGSTTFDEEEEDMEQHALVEAAFVDAELAAVDP